MADSAEDAANIAISLIPWAVRLGVPATSPRAAISRASEMKNLEGHNAGALPFGSAGSPRREALDWGPSEGPGGGRVAS